MKEKDKIWLKEQFDKLPFVKWDRYLWVQYVPDVLRAFGWIEREDAYKDFVVMEYVFEDPYNRAFFIQTSSAKYSKEISASCEGDGDHLECHKIEELGLREGSR